jgi:hypothetical protein
MRKSPPKAVKLKTESSEVFKALDNIAALQDGWNGGTAKALAPQIIENSKKLLGEVILPNCYGIKLAPDIFDNFYIIAKHKEVPEILLSFHVFTTSFEMKCMSNRLEFTFFGRFEQSSLNRLSKILGAL